jgi:hypothetical protein
LTRRRRRDNITLEINDFYFNIQINNHNETGAREGLIGKSVECRCGPATVIGSKSKEYHWRVLSLGRFGGAMI